MSVGCPTRARSGSPARTWRPRSPFVIGASGKFNHMVGLRRAGVVVAINPDADAPVFGFADYGIVADWREVVPELERRVRDRRGGRFAGQTSP